MMKIIKDLFALRIHYSEDHERYFFVIGIGHVIVELGLITYLLIKNI